MRVIDIGYIHMFNCDNYLKFSEINDTMYCICVMIKGPNKRPIYKESPKDLLKGLPRHLPPSFWDIWRPNFGTLVTETSVAQLRKKVRVFYGKLTIVHVGDLRTIINFTQFEAVVWARHNTHWKWKNPEERDWRCREVQQMQPMWLCILLCRQFEDTFENTQWRKVKQMQPM